MNIKKLGGLPLSHSSRVQESWFARLSKSRVDIVSHSPSSLKVKVSQLCPTLSDLMEYIIHGILQAGILEWVAFTPGDIPNAGTKSRSPALQADSLPDEPQGSSKILEWVAYPFSRGSS